MDPLDFLGAARSGPGLGIKMRRRRHELGLTQTELAGERFSKSYVSQIESGKVPPSLDALAYFAEQLGKPVDWFLTDAEETRKRIHLHLSDVQLALRRGLHTEAGDSVREAARLAMDLDEEHELAKVHESAGHLYLSQGDTSSAILAYREAAVLHRRSSQNGPFAVCLCSLANALLAGGSYDSAQVELQAARAVCATYGIEDPLVHGRMDLVAGWAAIASGNLASAQRPLNQALAAFTGRDLAGVGETHLALGTLSAAKRDWAAARLHFEHALARLDGVAAPAVLASASRRMAEACCQLGEWERASAMVRRAGALSEGLGDAQGVAWAAVRLAELELELGRSAGAREAATEAASLLGYEALGRAGLNPEPDVHWRRLYGAMLSRVFASLAAAEDDHETAARHLGHGAEAIRDVPGGLLLYVRVLHEQAATLAALGRAQDAAACYARALDDLAGNWPGTRPATTDYLDLARVPSPLWFR